MEQIPKSKIELSMAKAFEDRDPLVTKKMIRRIIGFVAAVILFLFMAYLIILLLAKVNKLIMEQEKQIHIDYPKNWIEINPQDIIFVSSDELVYKSKETTTLAPIKVSKTELPATTLSTKSAVKKLLKKALKSPTTTTLAPTSSAVVKIPTTKWQSIFALDDPEWRESFVLAQSYDDDFENFFGLAMIDED